MKKKVKKKVEKKVILKKKPLKKIVRKEKKGIATSVRKALETRVKNLTWVPAMSVHENKIDKQHQKLLLELILLFTNLKNKEQVGKDRQILHFFYEYVQEHLNYEESYMKKIDYPKINEHKKIHNRFRIFFKKFQKDFNNDLYTKPKPGESVSEKLNRLSKKCEKFLGDWWIHHIKVEDHKYAEYNDLTKNNLKSVMESEKKPKVFDMSSLKAEIQSQLKQQREPVEHISKLDLSKKKTNKLYIKLGVPGFDELFENGIPLGNTVLIAGGTGSGKTIFCLQTLINKANEGKKCIYVSFEEKEEKLIQHMEDFGWNPKELIKKERLKIVRMNPFDITRNVDAMLAKERGELLIDIDPVLLPIKFHPDFIVIDSLTAIASAFAKRDESYRIYIEQLFRFLEKNSSTSFLITETEQVPKIFSTSGVEEFLADGVIVLYNIKRGDVRENAIEVLKMRGEKHQKKIVAMQITDGGIVVYPEQEVFSDLE